jgi:hypothetical protein
VPLTPAGQAANSRVFSRNSFAAGPPPPFRNRLRDGQPATKNRSTASSFTASPPTPFTSQSRRPPHAPPGLRVGLLAPPARCHGRRRLEHDHRPIHPYAGDCGGQKQVDVLDEAQRPVWRGSGHEDDVAGDQRQLRPSAYHSPTVADRPVRVQRPTEAARAGPVAPGPPRLTVGDAVELSPAPIRAELVAGRAPPSCTPLGVGAAEGVAGRHRTERCCWMARPTPVPRPNLFCTAF